VRGLLWRLGSTGTVRKYREAAAAYRNVPCSSAYDSVDPSVPSGVVFAFAGMIVEMLVGSHVKSYGPPNVPWIPSKVAIVKDPVVLSSPGLPSSRSVRCTHRIPRRWWRSSHKCGLPRRAAVRYAVNQVLLQQVLTDRLSLRDSSPSTNAPE
jgi:hypothetical protein